MKNKKIAKLATTSILLLTLISCGKTETKIQTREILEKTENIQSLNGLQKQDLMVATHEASHDLAILTMQLNEGTTKTNLEKTVAHLHKASRDDTTEENRQKELKEAIDLAKQVETHLTTN